MYPGPWLAAPAKATEDPAPAAGVEKEIAEINAKITPWRFALPDYEFDSLKETMDDLVQKTEEKQEGEREMPAGQETK